MVLVHHITSSVAAAADSSSVDFSWGTLMLFVVGFLALAVVSSLGFIARIRDRATERKVEAARIEAARQSYAPSSAG